MDLSMDVSIQAVEAHVSTEEGILSSRFSVTVPWKRTWSTGGRTGEKYNDEPRHGVLLILRERTFTGNV